MRIERLESPTPVSNLDNVFSKAEGNSSVFVFNLVHVPSVQENQRIY